MVNIACEKENCDKEDVGMKNKESDTYKQERDFNTPANLEMGEKKALFAEEDVERVDNNNSGEYITGGREEKSGDQTDARTDSRTDVQADGVCVKRIINVEITEEIRSFIDMFAKNREDILNWCAKNSAVYSRKINEKTLNTFFNESKKVDSALNEKSINIDILSVLLYFYNLFCTHNNREKINAHSVMYSSCITYRGIYENIDQNSKSFKNLQKEEKKYKRLIGQTGNINDFFTNYKKTYPYGINLILGIFLTFLSGYYGSLLLGFTKFTTRLICGILFSYMTLILEVIIFIIINEKVENLKRSQKSMNSNDGLYEKVYFKREENDLEVTKKVEKAEIDEKVEITKIGEKVEEIKDVNKYPTLKQRKKT
ncbi:conserved Plasmodium protein, unknown function [Plasmodium ovale wallikeri]|uniref:Uncharacterized protein n=2 Tax=Plasmodium ovale TaxID=36330 RepID=A0A1A8ZPX9_PLAOA|nr:conserved Plasmodium protein, unknown function [Plasmodium ovale wallikeri]SBT45940.1 conserved Plasmodium protein, unknown function [Plasmodium ovale wallikeri]SBT78826.1 conserved Plasmodium protein, unknown function [Plasmodium ovale]